MRTIYKYPLGLVDVQTVMMPAGATILTAQVQHGLITLWAEVEYAEFETGRVIEIFGTGWSMMPAERRHIGTVQMNGGMVFHVYERLGFGGSDEPG